MNFCKQSFKRITLKFLFTRWEIRKHSLVTLFIVLMQTSVFATTYVVVSARWGSPFRRSQGTSKQTDRQTHSLTDWCFYRVIIICFNFYFLKGRSHRSESENLEYPYHGATIIRKKNPATVTNHSENPFISGGETLKPTYFYEKSSKIF